MKKFILAIAVFNISLTLGHTIKIYQGGPLEIITLGHPTLTMVAQDIPLEDIKTEKMQNFIDDMFKMMKNAGGVGLAAPQVNVSKRLFVMKPSFFAKGEAVINPLVNYNSERGQKSSTEGCLSIPGKQFKVKRYKDIDVTYYDRNGEFQAKNLTGFKAIVFQHEYDHLNGILISDFFTEYISDKDIVVPQM